MKQIKQILRDLAHPPLFSSFFFIPALSFISSPWLCQLYYHVTNKYVRQIELHAPNTHHNYRRPNKRNDSFGSIIGNVPCLVLLVSQRVLAHL